MRTAALVFACALPTVLGCSSGPTSVAIDVVTGLETDTFTADPAVTTVTITATDVSTGEVLTATSAPGGSFDLGDATSADAYQIEIEGVTAEGATVVAGRSLAIAPGVVSSGALPVFAERVNAWSRPPEGLATSRSHGVGLIADERYLVLAGGDASTSYPDVYDMATLGSSDATAALPQKALSAVGLGSVAVLVDDDEASYLYFDDGSTGDIPLPDGLRAWADVAGGKPVFAPDGSTYLVGATRTSSPSSAVVTIDADGNVGAVQLTAARAGAAATYVNGVGLVVAGGSATAAGVEVLADGATIFVSRPFPPDETSGAALVQTSIGVVLVGGVSSSGHVAPLRQVDPACASACSVTTPDGFAALPKKLVDTQVFAIDGNRVLVTGEVLQPTGAPAESLVYLLDVSAKTWVPVPLREPRLGATFVAAPNATLAAMGGVFADGTPALHVEMLFPQ